MEILIKVVQFFMSLSLLVAIHEFGHFIVARIFKIRVEKFYIFFDPWFSLFKWKRGETEYGLGWLPLGGYVKIAGMIDESMDLEQMQAPVQPWEFRAKPAWQRFCVMVAGVVMNILLAMMIYSGVRYTWGESYLANEDVKWGYNFNEAGERMGFKDGDKILSIDDQAIVDVNEIRQMLLLTKEDRHVVVERAGEQLMAGVAHHVGAQDRIAARDDVVVLVEEKRQPAIVDVGRIDGAQSLLGLVFGYVRYDATAKVHRLAVGVKPKEHVQMVHVFHVVADTYGRLCGILQLGVLDVTLVECCLEGYEVCSSGCHRRSLR
jgi:regulator of sigma E protease